MSCESEAPCEKALRPLIRQSHRRAGARCVVPVFGGTSRFEPGSELSGVPSFGPLAMVAPCELLAPHGWAGGVGSSLASGSIGP